MRALAPLSPLSRASLLAVAIGMAALPFHVGQAGAQGRYPRIEMLDAGDLGGEPHRPALAGGIWAGDPLILGVEPDLDRTFLFRLGWLGGGSLADAPAGQAAVAGDGPGLAPARDIAELPAEGRRGAGSAGSPGSPGSPGSAGEPDGLPPQGAEFAPAAGRTVVPSGGVVAPSLPEILAFPPLPPGVLEMAVGGSGAENLVVWAAAEGPSGAPNVRLSARRIGRDGTPVGEDLTLQVGPSRPADLSVAVAPDGEAIVAWSNHLAGRGAGMRWRAIGRTDALGPLRMDWDISSDQGSPSVVVQPGGFALAHLRTTLQGESPGGERAIAGPSDAPASEELAPDVPVPIREIRVRRLGPGGSPRGEPALVAARKGLDHPIAVNRNGTISLFWTDPRGGGRMLRTRTYGADGSPLGPEGSLRTDLRMTDLAPYRIAPAGDGYWLVIWPQMEGRGHSMVLEARLFHSSGNAAGPPLLVARSPGAIALRDFIESRGADRWVALWTEEEAGQYRLRYRPMRREGKG